LALRTLAALCSLLAACNVVELRERSLQAQARRAGMLETTTPTSLDRVRLSRGGAGRPLLLLHGFGASAIWQWHGQLADFAAAHDVVMPDLLGFGGSSSPSADPSLDRQVAAMLGVLDELGLERVDVVGISYGGLVAYSLAAQHPERVRRLVLVDTPGHAWSATEHRALLRRFDARTATELFVPSSVAGIRTLMAIAWYRPPGVPAWAARQVITSLYDPHRADQVALLEQLEADIDGMASAIARPSAPSLVVWGADDPVFPVAVGRRLAHDLGAELVVLDRARHLPNAEHPARFNRVVLEFLDAPE